MGEFAKSEISSFLPFVVQASAQALTEYNLDNAHERNRSSLLSVILLRAFRRDFHDLVFFKLASGEISELVLVG